MPDLNRGFALEEISSVYSKLQNIPISVLDPELFISDPDLTFRFRIRNKFFLIFLTYIFLCVPAFLTKRNSYF